MVVLVLIRDLLAAGDCAADEATDDEAGMSPLPPEGHIDVPSVMDGQLELSSDVLECFSCDSGLACRCPARSPLPSDASTA